MKPWFLRSLTIGFALVLVGSRSVADPGAPRSSIRLPDDILVSGSLGLPKDLSAFLGAWGGDSWGGNLPTVLVVESVTADGTARVVYAWGDSFDGKIKSGFDRMVGRVADGRLSCGRPRGPKIEYEWLEDGALLGRYESGRSVSYVRLKSMPGTTSVALQPRVRDGRQLWQEIRIPETSNVGETKGRTFALLAMFYPSANPGRQPLMIFSHGSTGGGEINPKDFPQVMDRVIPRVFLSLGFNVVQPLRKGFGDSNAPLVEEASGREPQENQLDSALEDLDATMQYLLRRSYVDPRQIVLVGQSRGGLLSVAYAGRHRALIAGVINFAGGWWGERASLRGFNLQQFREAGRLATVPMLWLYAANDSYYSLPYVRNCFAAFQASGGKGQLLQAPAVAGDGHLLLDWPDLWRPQVAAYLRARGFK